jgi:hypothetical protein
MSGSTLNPSEEGQQVLGRGHGTGALGPSDSSDSGSDVQGAVRHPGDVEDALDAHALEQGEVALNSDTDRAGTGERAAADGDGTLVPDADIVPQSTDNIADIADETGLAGDDDTDLAAEQTPAPVTRRRA